MCRKGNQKRENQARKKSTEINFLGPETTRWGGGLPREGVVAEEFVPSLESLSSLGFEETNLGASLNFRGQKGPTKPKIRVNSTKEFSEQFEGVTGHYPVKQGF